MPTLQRCHLANVWLTWVLVPAIALLMGWWEGWIAGAVVLLAGVGFQVLYVRAFPRFSQMLGYGSVADRPANGAPMPDRLPLVTIYTASVCPFCPLVKTRLAKLREQRPFELREIDITFRPEIVRAKHLRSVPVIEVNGRTLVGNVTTAELTEFLRESAVGG